MPIVSEEATLFELGFEDDDEITELMEALEREFSGETVEFPPEAQSDLLIVGDLLAFIEDQLNQHPELPSKDATTATSHAT